MCRIVHGTNNFVTSDVRFPVSCKTARVCTRDCLSSLSAMVPPDNSGVDHVQLISQYRVLTPIPPNVSCISVAARAYVADQEDDVEFPGESVVDTRGGGGGREREVLCGACTER